MLFPPGPGVRSSVFEAAASRSILGAAAALLVVAGGCSPDAARRVGAAPPDAGQSGLDALDGAGGGSAGGDARASDGAADGVAPLDSTAADGLLADGPLADGRPDLDAAPGTPPDMRPDLLPDLPPDSLPDLPPAPVDSAPPVSLYPPGRAVDYCSGIPALPTTQSPTIDGTLDYPLPLQELPQTSWNMETDPAPPAGHLVQLAMGWRADCLYVYYRVTDPQVVSSNSPTPWCEDAAQLFLDLDGTYTAPPAYDETGTRQIIVSAPAAGAPGSHIVLFKQEYVGTTTSPSLRVFPIAGGYALEGLIGEGLMGAPVSFASGGAVGLNVQVDVAATAIAGDSCPRQGSFILSRGPAGAALPYADVTSFCRASLLAPF